MTSLIYCEDIQFTVGFALLHESQKHESSSLNFLMIFLKFVFLLSLLLKCQRGSKTWVKKERLFFCLLCVLNLSKWLKQKGFLIICCLSFSWGVKDPDAEVIELSPKTLMATNRFICEVCNKGFQREQNLQLHRRGHNLPWKLKQKSTKEQKRKVYLCPEPTCVHHDPSRALGDLTGIKKHYSRKHGEKKWKCEKCSKKYAVQSDWKAHSKTCGTREYRCDCGTLFSR